MAYRNPAFGILHVGDDLGTNLSSANAVDADFPLANIADRRVGALCKFSGSASTHDWRFDRTLAVFGVRAFDRLFIPSGHNLNTTTLTVFSSTTGFGVSETNLGSVAATTALVDLSVTSDANRYIRVDITGTGTYEAGEVWLTDYRQTTSGLVPGWRDVEEGAFDAVDLPGVTATLSQGPNRKRFRLEHRALDGADLTIYEDLFTECAQSQPFLFWPPDDAETVRVVQLVGGSIRKEQDHPAPKASITYKVELQMLQVTA